MKRQIFMLQAAALLLAACSEKGGPLPEGRGPQASEGMVTEIIACVEDMQDDAKTAGFQTGDFSWTAGDRLGFWPDVSLVAFGQPRQVLFYVATYGSSRASFKGNGWGLLKGNHMYYSYYPYDETATAQAVTMNYEGQRQSANASTAHLGGYDYLHSYLASVPDKGSVQLTYVHLGCLAEFVVTVPQEYASHSFTSMTLSAAEPVLVKSATYNPSSTSPTLPEEGKVKSNTLSLALGGSRGVMCDADGKLVLYAMMSPVAWFGKTISLLLCDTDGVEFKGTFTPTKNQVAGKAYEYPTTIAPSGAAINLSASEPANCYIVSKAGDYKFEAVEGNTSAPVNVGGVKVLWESDGTAAAPAVGSRIKPQVKYEDGFVYFSTADTFVKGNALIAAYADAACTGDVLWSWHIWLTDMPAHQEYKFDAGYLMDRNLGALSVTGDLSAGMFYQWGRKDPFPGTASISTGQQYMASTGSFSNVNVSSEIGTVAWATAHPTSFICSPSTEAGPICDFDWLYNEETVTRTWYGGDVAPAAKTKYDPCPPGYRVPAGSTTADTEEGRGFWAKALGFNRYLSGWLYDGITTPAGKVTLSNVTHLLQMPIADGGYAYYPTTGFLSDTDGALGYVGTNLMIWGNYPAGADQYANWNTQYSGCFDMNNKELHTNWNSGRAAGKSMRCLRMGSDEPQSPEDNEGFTPIPGTW